MTPPPPLSQEQLMLAVASRVRGLTTVVIVLALAVVLLFAAQYGALVNYWDGDAVFFGVTSTGAAAVGFVLGWLAGRLRFKGPA